MSIYFRLLLTLTSVTVIIATDVSVKGDQCSKFDSCYAKPQQRTCSCTEDCQVYGTCCPDYNRRISKHSSVPFYCYHHRTITPVSVKRSCAENYGGHIRDIEACYENDIDEMDVNNNLLVTSHKTKITYWNFHCAICNGEVEEDLELWNIEVFCPPREQIDRWLIRRNLTFDADIKQWGLNIEGEFLQCAVKYASPPYIDEGKYCNPELISTCPADYPKKKIVSRCSQYYGERRLQNSGKYYRNVHCAICNGINIKELTCPGMRKSEDEVEEMDYSEMVEEVFTNGEWLDKEEGQRFQCSKGFSYDPFTKKCRRERRKLSAPLLVDIGLSSSQALQFGLSSWLSVLLVMIFNLSFGK